MATATMAKVALTRPVISGDDEKDCWTKTGTIGCGLRYFIELGSK